MVTPPKPKKKSRKKSKNVPRPVIFAEPVTSSNSFVGTEEYIAPVRIPLLSCSWSLQSVWTAWSDFLMFRFKPRLPDCNLFELTVLVAQEIISGLGHSSAVDWWALGILLYEMLFGRTPFRGKNRQNTFSNILEKELYFPSSIPVSFWAWLTGDVLHLELQYYLDQYLDCIQLMPKYLVLSNEDLTLTRTACRWVWKLSCWYEIFLTKILWRGLALIVVQMTSRITHFSKTSTGLSYASWYVLVQMLRGSSSAISLVVCSRMNCVVPSM